MSGPAAGELVEELVMDYQQTERQAETYFHIVELAYGLAEYNGGDSYQYHDETLCMETLLRRVLARRLREYRVPAEEARKLAYCVVGQLISWCRENPR